MGEADKWARVCSTYSLQPRAYSLARSAGAFARPWMRCVVNSRQMLKIKVGVDLGGRDVGMAEQFLNAAQVLARFEQVGGEGMAEHVRIDMDADALQTRPARDAQLNGPCSQP